MTPLTFVGFLCVTPRVGQNAVLESIATVVPGAAEWGAARAPDGRLVASFKPPLTADAWVGWDISNTEWGRPVHLVLRDKVAQAISWAIAAQTGRYRSDAPVMHSLEYRRVDIQSALDVYAAQEAINRKYFDGRGPLVIVYEDHIETDPRVAAKMILDWWGIGGDPGPPSIVRHEATEKAEWRERWDRGE